MTYKKNLISFKKSKPTQFAQLWTEENNDYKIPKKIITECLKEQASY